MAKKNRVAAASAATPKLTKRQISRHQREQQQRRILYGVMVATVLVVAGLIGYGILREQVLLPNESVVTVNGVALTRDTYWKHRRYDLAQQMQQLQFQAQFGGQNVQFVRERLESLQRELREYRTAPLDVMTLERMATNELLRQQAGTVGVEVTEADIQDAIERDFAPPPATPTPVPPAEATQTAVAATAIATLTPAPTTVATEAAVAGTPMATPTPTMGPTATPTPFVTPTVTPSPTPMNDEARATANVTFRDQSGALRQVYGMTAQDYRELVVKPRLLEERVKAALAEQVEAEQLQVRAAHILVASEEAATEIEQQLDQGADFAELAREQSTDPGSKEKGGDLDWFPRGVMTPEFERVAFELEPGVISEPVQSPFGWHIIKVMERAEARPVVPNLLSQLRENRYQEWLKEQLLASTVTSPVTLPSFEPEDAPDAPATPVP